MAKKITAALSRRHHHLRAWSGHFATQTDRGLFHQADKCPTCKANAKAEK